ncbi:uncharacterized protein LOC127731991 isoform X5 [Mytilus californianus]|uniref:uncharacterized protein LOC127731991 isoform X2 n=1 Tax=Mytilus californianus TaxID=6549 RepID=UPI002248305A|nr:uncharacterized protein LOC127731991 isoform X2 [Mytilus californianus]XP_052096989.1 uncharacterized protein LOC127731991 isoform X3 [Mytilus californianus]XP_052096990.1 uncharacterized protein LOC127731991 isoform X4 [Mytilus californianus]XP_052096991.1 uncharacterized protein LOC127731991 isoform X5 [Mytilus californianus]
MEDSEDSGEFEDLEIDEHHVIKIQAWIRGDMVRKWFNEIRSEYEKLVSDIEKSKSVIVEWPNAALGMPRVRKHKLKRNVQEVPPNVSARNSPNIEFLRSSVKYSEVHAKSKDTTEVYHINSTRSWNSSDFSETSYKPVVQSLKHTESQGNSGVISNFTHQSLTNKINSCTIETQTSMDEETLSVVERHQNNNPRETIGQPTRETTGQQNPVRTFDMLIQTDDLPFYKEEKNIDLQTEKMCTQVHTTNRQILEQKINKFENQLRTLNDVSLKDSVQDSSKTSAQNNKTPSQLGQKVGPISALQFGGSPKQETVQLSSVTESQRGRRPSYHQESSVLTNVTSVWDSFSSDCKENTPSIVYPNDPKALRGMRKNVAMELLWVQQAIDSRKNYLKLKNQMRVAT